MCIRDSSPLRAELADWARRARSAGLEKDDVGALFTAVLESTYESAHESTRGDGPYEGTHGGEPYEGTHGGAHGEGTSEGTHGTTPPSTTHQGDQDR